MLYHVCIIVGVGVLVPFRYKKLRREGLTMTMGSCDNSFGSVRQENSALFSLCQVVSHKNFKNIVAGDGDICALLSAFLYALKGGDAVW